MLFSLPSNSYNGKCSQCGQVPHYTFGFDVIEDEDEVLFSIKLGCKCGEVEYTFSTIDAISKGEEFEKFVEDKLTEEYNKKFSSSDADDLDNSCDSDLESKLRKALNSMGFKLVVVNNMDDLPVYSDEVIKKNYIEMTVFDRHSGGIYSIYLNPTEMGKDSLIYRRVDRDDFIEVLFAASDENFTEDEVIALRDEWNDLYPNKDGGYSVYDAAKIEYDKRLKDPLATAKETTIKPSLFDALGKVSKSTKVDIDYDSMVIKDNLTTYDPHYMKYTKEVEILNPKIKEAVSSDPWEVFKTVRSEEVMFRLNGGVRNNSIINDQIYLSFKGKLWYVSEITSGTFYPNMINAVIVEV